MALFSRFLGRTASEGAAFAFGAASGPVLAPAVEGLRQAAWSQHQNRAVAVAMLAEGVATGQIGHAEAVEQAKRTGYSETELDRMVRIFDTGPGVAEAFRLWRRGVLDGAGFRRALKREALEDEWIDALAATRDVLLSPSEAANAWQQGFMSEAESEAEAGRSGVPPARAQIQRELAGLPPGAMDGLTLLRRGLIDEATYRQIVREGHTKVKYTDALLGLRDHVIAATNAASLWLKGWLTEAEAKRIGALNGYDAEAMDLLYKDRGRPATVRQAHVGYARGGRLPGAANELETLRRSVEESNIRSEWFDILYAQRFTYPSAFVLRALASDGTFSVAMTEQILTESGWKPEWAKLAAEKWGAGSGGATAQKWADRARTRLFTVTHNEYLDESIDAGTVRVKLTAIGIGDAEQTTVLELWDEEVAINRLELTPAQIRKAYKKALYTREVALAELDERGMTPEDAETFLDSG